MDFNSKIISIINNTYKYYCKNSNNTEMNIFSCLKILFYSLFCFLMLIPIKYLRKRILRYSTF